MLADDRVGVAQEEQVIALGGRVEAGPTGQGVRFDVEVEGVELLRNGAAGGVVEVDDALADFREEAGVVAGKNPGVL
jgi:hypothetical protein